MGGCGGCGVGGVGGFGGRVGGGGAGLGIGGQVFSVRGSLSAETVGGEYTVLPLSHEPFVIGGVCGGQF